MTTCLSNGSSTRLCSCRSPAPPRRAGSWRGSNAGVAASRCSPSTATSRHRELAALTARAAGRTAALVSHRRGGRRRHPAGPPRPAARTRATPRSARSTTPALTRRVYRSIGAELAARGVNLDFAPSADVNTADDNPVIGTRAFGSDPDAGRAGTPPRPWPGCRRPGVAACAKHFPGHGATVAGLPPGDPGRRRRPGRCSTPRAGAVPRRDRGRRQCGHDRAHLACRRYTGATPATLSPAAITGLLRGTLGYDGVVVTDALDMRAASGAIGIPEAAVRALAAGADLLCLGSKEYEDSVRAIRERIVEAVRRGRGCPPTAWRRPRRGSPACSAWLGRAADRRGRPRALGLEAARRAVRVTGSPSVAAATAGAWSCRPRPTSRSARCRGAWRRGPPDAVPGRRRDGRRRPRSWHAPPGRPLVVVVRDAHRYPGAPGAGSGAARRPGPTPCSSRWGCRSGVRRHAPRTSRPTARRARTHGPPPRSSA